MTREDIIKWAQEAQLPYYFPAVAKQQQTGEIAYGNELMLFADLVAEAERKREWVGLTDEEIQTIVNKVATGTYQTSDTFARAIEAKLKKKNQNAN